MTISPALTQLFQSFGLAGVVTLLVNILAPWLERTPLATPGSSTHDATLRALNLILNVGCAFGAAALLGQLASGQAVLAAIGFGVAQATGSHLLYTSGNRQSPAPSAPAPAPSLATIAATSAAAVANAVNAAIAAQTS